ncbi:MAG TPA: hypothetical protein VFE12_20405 [Acetobacteraceae bacterium]|nr:hypothetical protein [Acetobacteraceae bacterium]
MNLAKTAPLVLVALALAGCGGRSKKEEMAASYCPQPLTVQDAQRITRFKQGSGRDPRDVVFEAQMLGAVTSCSLGRNKMEVDVVMRIAVNAGPAISGGVTRVPFFVRVLGPGDAVVQGSDQLADYKISQASPRGVSDETMAVTLPFSEMRELGAYRIAVGLKPTAQELEYNRRGEQR